MFAAAASAGAWMLSGQPTAQSPGPCDPPNSNQIVCENAKPGNLPTEWDIDGAGDDTIQGFATDISVDQGQTVTFKIDTDATAYHLDIYRMGYYGGMGARKIATVTPSATLPQNQPNCLQDGATGLLDCGNWGVSATWAVPTTAVSGIYFARVIRNDTLGASHIVFIVRDDDGHADLLFQTSDTTWQAYNRYGGNSLYVGGPGTNPGRAYKVSYNRPFTTRGTSPEDWVFNAEYPMVRWLEANGYNVSYATGVDSDRSGAELLEHKAFLSVGHDEYWSGGQRANVEAARGAGVHLAFFSGNEVFWKTRWENSISAGGTPYRTLVSYKETHANAKIDPLPNVWTGTWADKRFSPPADGGQSQNALTGTFFRVNCCSDAIEVPAADGKMRLWRNTAIAQQPNGGVYSMPAGTLGYEWDADEDNGFRPAGLFRMSSTVLTEPQVLQDFGSTYNTGTAEHAVTMYKNPSGALVFGAGTVQWSWALDSNHDRGNADPDVAVQQATINLFADMGVQPLTVQGGLFTASASTDTIAPSSSIATPAAGATVAPFSTVTISGTAVDAGGGNVAGVEISIDGGATWHPVQGRVAWTYSWSTGAAGQVTVRTRAVDDSGNLETPGTGILVTVGGSTGGSCPCSIWSTVSTPANPAESDSSSVELGVKFKPSTSGFITAIRYYKSAANTGAHQASLWSATGALLGTAPFSGESTSGWQEVTLPNPVAVTAGVTYVASYHTNTGFYAADGGYFGASGVTNGPLQALADGADGPNGIYHYGSSAFPTDTFNSTNYWVDVVFVTTVVPDTTPPTVTTTTPAPGTGGVAANTTATAAFSESIDASTVSTSTFDLRNASNALVPANVTYSASTRTATLQPTSALVYGATYTARVKGGSTGVKDTAGNALVADVVWSFTTSASPPPLPTSGPGGPILVIASAGNPFSTYYAEILRAEGLTGFTVMDVSLVTATVLNAYDVAIVGDLPLTAAQVTMLTNWVTGGGNLIAMRPDKKLASLLGLTDGASTLGDAYIRVNTSAAPGAGIVSDTMQFHGNADLYALSGATAIATLYSTSTIATTNPAVTVQSVGSLGGQAVAFTYDLARSVVYTRQGNPAWSGQERDGVTPVRSDDLFFGGSQPDYVDLTKVAIPQADEQQRLLANVVGFVNADKRPLPKFWYFPGGAKAAIVMTGDDHSHNGTQGRFDIYKAASAPGCVVDDWQCIRSTSYIFPDTPISDQDAAAYVAQGFEVALHLRVSGPNTQPILCNDFTAASLNQDYTDQLAQMSALFPSVPPSATNRTHCIVWSDYDSQPQIELSHGIRLDTSYYYWPDTWINNVPGMFTGSGMPMRFAKADGTMIDVYQAATQMTDESGQTYPFNVNTLLDRALGPEGYYGAFVANMHTDTADEDGSVAIVASAQARNVPIISAKQLLDWTDGRNASTVTSLSWNGSSLGFTVTVGAKANRIQTMMPFAFGGRTLASVTRNGSPATYTVQTVKGVSYGFVTGGGVYQAQYAVDTTPPVISGLTATPVSQGATITWSTNEVATSRIDYGTTPTSLTSTAADGSFVTAHSVSLSGLANSTTYYYRATSADGVGNSTTSPATPGAPASFVTPAAPSLGCPCNIWPGTTVPGTGSANDQNSVELGLKFRTNVSGYITGVRFYKGSANPGPHTGNLWALDGTLLATVTFSNETPTGWQQALFPTPVAVSSNTPYVISYHTDSGGYAIDGAFFAAGGVVRGPLEALADGVSGGNAVYAYGASSFPVNTFNSANYWVDVVFDTVAPPDVTPPALTGTAPINGASAVNIGTAISATFNEALSTASVGTSTFELRDASNALVPATVSYASATRTATLQPSSALNYRTTYTAVLHGGATGIKDLAGNPLSADVTWSFTTAPPPPTVGPGGPIGVVTSAANPFSTYYAEILRAEGLNEFTVIDVNAMTAASLNAFDLVVLGDLPLTTDQVTTLTAWVTGGGNLIAMRPDKKLAALLGLTDAASTLPDAYLQVSTASAPGAGIVGDTMQFHGTADRYSLNGASAIATLFSSATVSSGNPAVTIRSVGSAGGQAAAFTYDLARSVIYTRQGNPAWSGQERDAQAPIRSDDLFFGGTQPDYVDLSKVAIPQADEQQRLLANLIGFMNVDRKPLPRFWYLPRGLKAAVVMTGDDHGLNGTAGRFDIYNANSTPGCSVDDWQCVRATSYIFPNTPISNAAVAGYVAQGFEIGAHMWMSGLASGSTDASSHCNDFTPVSADADYSQQVSLFSSLFPAAGPVRSNRTHCVVWSDYDTQPQVELAHGIRLDTNYYYWPDTWIRNAPGLFTGSGLPQRFAKADGTMLDIYQATTQMTDESGQTYPLNIDTLLDRAIGPLGYYGTFVANMHTDTAVHAGSVAIVASAQARGVPVISAAQLLDWTDGRNSSSFDNIAWNGSSLSFTLTRGARTNGLQAMVPASTPAGPLAGILVNGVPVDFSVNTIKGVTYAFVAAGPGTYEVRYGVDTIPPVLSAIAVATQATSATVGWHSNEPTTSRVDYGLSATSLVFNATVSGLTGSHSVPLTGLASNTTYYFKVTSADASGNSVTAPSTPGTFSTTAVPPVAVGDTTRTDFSAGTLGTGAYISLIADGEVMLAPAGGTEFDGTTLPAGSTSTPWTTGGTSVVSGGFLTVDGARVSSDTVIPPGVSLDFVATFATDAFQHIGFGLTLNETPWAIFSTGSGGALYARTNNGVTATDTPIAGSWLGSPHRYRIDWTATSVVYSIDGAQVASHPIAISTSMRPLISDANPGAGTVVVDWMHVLPYATSGTFTSRVLDANAVTAWSRVSWVASVPSGTTLAMAVRFGNTAVPDGTWTAFQTLAASGASVSQSSRFAQYRITMTGNGSNTPTVESVTITAGSPPPSLSVADVTKTEGNSGTSNAVFTIRLSSAMAIPVSVSYATANDTAVAGTDYIATSGTANFPAGTTSVVVNVPIIGDTTQEPSERFFLNLFSPVNATLSDPQAIGTIADDDSPAFSIAGVTVNEGNSGTTNASFVVSLSMAVSQTATVNFQTSDGTATAGSDYTTTSGTLSFPAGTLQRTILVPIIGDTRNEPNETFQVALSNPVNAIIGTSTATGSITNDDPVPQVSIGNASVTEGNSGSANATFTVTLSAVSGQTVTVGYATANGTATAGADYTATSGTLTFPAGTTTQTINVPVLGDTVDEPNETFVVNLSNPTNATIGTAQGTGTIVDNDLPALSINSVSVTEGATSTVPATFTVTLSSASTSTVTVNYATANGTAVSGSDYTAASGQLSFAPGTTSRTVTVTVLADSLDEANETFTVNLTSPVNATIATAQGTGTIVDSDPTPSLSINNVTVTEGNTGTTNATLTVTLSAASGQTVTVNYATADGTATQPADYTSTSGTLTFTPGTTSRTITVPIKGDTLDEANDTVNVNLSSATNATIADAQGVITINDDDATPSLTINDASITEGNSGTKTMTFTVTLSAASGRTVTVNYATANGTASSSSDYIATSGTLTFAAGTTTQTISVTIRGDTTRESNETFAVNLSGATNATIADSQGTGTILNDD